MCSERDEDIGACVSIEADDEIEPMPSTPTTYFVFAVYYRFTWGDRPWFLISWNKPQINLTSYWQMSDWWWICSPMKHIYDVCCWPFAFLLLERRGCDSGRNSNEDKRNIYDIYNINLEEVDRSCLLQIELIRLARFNFMDLFARGWSFDLNFIKKIINFFFFFNNFKLLNVHLLIVRKFNVVFCNKTSQQKRRCF